MKIGHDAARVVLRRAASDTAKVSPAWVSKVERLSLLCEQANAKTHIAFLATVMLAKAVDRRADLFAIKPEHAADNANAFSARSLSESVVVPLAAEIGFSLGVTGRQPLNNQPYFRMTRLDDGTPVQGGSRPAFDFMLTLVSELQAATESEAEAALASFIKVRREYLPTYADHVGVGESLAPQQLIRAIESLLQRGSEGGRIAQAVAAGLLDVFAGSERVESGRINDPSRHYPGDVAISDVSDPGRWEKAFEVRDKPVSMSDIHIFAAKCVAVGVREAAVLMVSPQQQAIDKVALANWANARGIGLRLFQSWSEFVEQVLFWSTAPQPVSAAAACALIHARLVEIEASGDAVAYWSEITREAT